VDKKCFSPRPRINSWLIKLKKKEKFSDMESILISILGKTGKLKNAILYSLIKKGKTKRESRRIIKDMNIPEQVLEKPGSRITGRFLIRLAENLRKTR
jgi:16S rRNA A1518/A1519 N6-dimethyltransferase RsmA/KsgA/DIM1 with predicted DNA glycosylase/AP lyase activity